MFRLYTGDPQNLLRKSLENKVYFPRFILEYCGYLELLTYSPKIILGDMESVYAMYIQLLPGYPGRYPSKNSVSKWGVRNQLYKLCGINYGLPVLKDASFLHLVLRQMWISKKNEIRMKRKCSLRCLSPCVVIKLKSCELSFFNFEIQVIIKIKFCWKRRLFLYALY